MNRLEELLSNRYSKEEIIELKALIKENNPESSTILIGENMFKKHNSYNHDASMFSEAVDVDNSAVTKYIAIVEEHQVEMDNPIAASQKTAIAEYNLTKRELAALFVTFYDKATALFTSKIESKGEDAFKRFMDGLKERGIDFDTPDDDE